LDPQENYKQELETENIALSEVVKWTWTKYVLTNDKNALKTHKVF
jgi:hypothetical protein